VAVPQAAPAAGAAAQDEPEMSDAVKTYRDRLVWRGFSNVGQIAAQFARVQARAIEAKGHGFMVEHPGMPNGKPFGISVHNFKENKKTVTKEAITALVACWQWNERNGGFPR